MPPRDSLADFAGPCLLTPVGDRAAQFPGLIEEDVDGELAAAPVLLYDKIIAKARGGLELLQVSCDVDSDRTAPGHRLEDQRPAPRVGGAQYGRNSSGLWS